MGFFLVEVVTLAARVRLICLLAQPPDKQAINNVRDFAVCGPSSNCDTKKPRLSVANADPLLSSASRIQSGACVIVVVRCWLSFSTGT